MIGLAEVAALAKRELGEMVMATPLRVSCPTCGKFLVAPMSAPCFVRAHCARCRQDVVVLVSRKGEIMTTTEL